MKSYSLSEYFRNVGIIINILELTANKNNKRFTTRIKFAANMCISYGHKGVGRLIVDFRNTLVHDSIDFKRLKTITIMGDITNETLSNTMYDLSKYIGFEISKSELEYACGYVVNFIDYMYDNLDSMKDMYTWEPNEKELKAK